MMNRECMNLLHLLFLITLLYKVDDLAKPSSQIRVTAGNVLIITLTVNQGNALSAELFNVLSLSLSLARTEIKEQRFLVQRPNSITLNKTTVC